MGSIFDVFAAAANPVGNILKSMLLVMLTEVIIENGILKKSFEIKDTFPNFRTTLRISDVEF